MSFSKPCCLVLPLTKANAAGAPVFIVQISSNSIPECGSKQSTTYEEKKMTEGIVVADLRLHSCSYSDVLFLFGANCQIVD